MRAWCRRLLAGVLLACGLPLLSGCWSRHEIEDLAIVMAAALDAAPGNQVRLSVFVIVPRAVGGGPSMGGGGGGEPPKTGEVVSATGSDFAQAIRRLEGQVPRHLYWAQNRVLVIGADLASRGLYYLDLFIRDRQMRLTTPVLITRGEARQMLNLPPGIELSPGTILTGILRNHTTFTVELKDLLAMWEAQGDNPALPEVVMASTQGQGSQAPGSAGGQGAGGGSKAGEQKQQPEAVVIKGAGAFRYDRLAGWLDEREANGLMWLRGKVMEGVITVSLPPGTLGPPAGQGAGQQQGSGAGQGQGTSTGGNHVPGQGGAPGTGTAQGERQDLPPVQTAATVPIQASIAFHRINTDTQARVEGQQVVFTVNIKGHGDLLEVLGNFNPDDMNQLQVIQEAVNKEITDRAQAAVTKAQQELRADLFGFGEILHRSNSRYWHQVKDQWNDEFPRAQVQVKVDIQLRRVGMTNRTPGIIRATGSEGATQGNSK